MTRTDATPQRPRVVGDEREAATRLLDAAESILVADGYPAVTTRRLGAVAGVNHGLVHYYWDSLEDLLAAVLERFTQRQLDRQRALYGRDVPFLERWREAVGHLLESDRENGHHKVWLELQALAWNRPGMRERVAAVDAARRAVVVEALERAVAAGEVDTRGWPLEAVVALVVTANEGMLLQQRTGAEAGHSALLDVVEQALGGGSGWAHVSPASTGPSSASA